MAVVLEGMGMESALEPEMVGTGAPAQQRSDAMCRPRTRHFAGPGKEIHRNSCERPCRRAPVSESLHVCAPQVHVCVHVFELLTVQAV